MSAHEKPEPAETETTEPEMSASKTTEATTSESKMSESKMPEPRTPEQATGEATSAKHTAADHQQDRDVSRLDKQASEALEAIAALHDKAVTALLEIAKPENDPAPAKKFSKG